MPSCHLCAAPQRLLIKQIAVDRYSMSRSQLVFDPQKRRGRTAASFGWIRPGNNLRALEGRQKE
jgi:hypothetical protein